MFLGPRSMLFVKLLKRLGKNYLINVSLILYLNELLLSTVQKRENSAGMFVLKRFGPQMLNRIHFSIWRKMYHFQL